MLMRHTLHVDERQLGLAKLREMALVAVVRELALVVSVLDVIRSLGRRSQSRGAKDILEGRGHERQVGVDYSQQGNDRGKDTNGGRAPGDVGGIKRQHGLDAVAGDGNDARNV